MHALLQRRQWHHKAHAGARLKRRLRRRVGAALLRLLRLLRRQQALDLAQQVDGVGLGGQQGRGAPHLDAVHVHADRQVSTQSAFQAGPAVHPPRLDERHLPRQLGLRVPPDRHRVVLQACTAQRRRPLSTRRAADAVEQHGLLLLGAVTAGGAHLQAGRKAAAARQGRLLQRGAAHTILHGRKLRALRQGKGRGQWITGCDQAASRGSNGASKRFCILVT